MALCRAHWRRPAAQLGTQQRCRLEFKQQLARRWLLLLVVRAIRIFASTMIPFFARPHVRPASHPEQLIDFGQCWARAICRPNQQ